MKTLFSSWALTAYYDEVMEVHSSAIIRIPVRSHNQGPLINHLSLNSNYQTVRLERDGYGAKLPTKDIVRGQKINLASTTGGARYSLFFTLLAVAVFYS